MVRALVLGELAWARRTCSTEAGTQCRAWAAGRELLRDTLQLLPRRNRRHHQRQRCRPPGGPCSRVGPGRCAARAGGAHASAADPQLLDIFRNEADTHLNSLPLLSRPPNTCRCRPLTSCSVRCTPSRAVLLWCRCGADRRTGGPFDQLAREYKAHLLALDLDEADLLLEAGLLRRGLAQLQDDPLKSQVFLN